MKEMKEKKEFTILMPCLNEAKSLAFCIEEARAGIRRLSLDAEILIADNGSEDGSPDIARQCGVRVITAAEKGYGAALRAGIRAAHGRYILMGDADGSYDFSRPDLFVEALRRGDALVVGNRFRGGIAPGAMPLSHRLGVPFLSFLGRLRFGAPVGDFHCGIRAFEREKALSLPLCCGGMEFATEMIAAFARSGAKVTEVPAQLRRDRRGGKSHLRTIPDGCRHLYYILFLKSIPPHK